MHAETPGDPSGLQHVGEGWAGASHRVGRHTHDGWELYLQLHGLSTWAVGDRTLHLAPGWLVAVPPRTPHQGAPRVRAATDRHQFAYAAVDMGVVGARMPRVRDAWAARGTLCSAQGRDVAPLLRRLVAEVSEDRPLRTEALVAAVDLLVVEASRVLLAGTGATHRVRHPEVLRARRLLDEEYATPWTVASLATACGTSRSRLARLFVADVGQAPYRYLLERRVERAAELLVTTPYPVAEVAALVGFGSHVQLARRFRQLRGVSPGQWRRGEGVGPPVLGR